MYFEVVFSGFQFYDVKMTQEFRFSSFLMKWSLGFSVVQISCLHYFGLSRLQVIVFASICFSFISSIIRMNLLCCPRNQGKHKNPHQNLLKINIPSTAVKIYSYLKFGIIFILISWGYISKFMSAGETLPSWTLRKTLQNRVKL